MASNRLLVKQLMIIVLTLNLQVTSADMVSVHLGDNITLSCNTTNNTISWYRLQSEELKLIIRARKAKLGNSFSPSFNVDEGHYDVTENRSLVINRFGDADLGVYYCAGQITTLILDRKPITLNFTDNPNQEAVSSADLKPDRCQVLNITLTCVCSVSFLINIVCICVFSFQVKGKSSPSLTCCSDSNTTYTPEKEINLHYATFTQQRDSGRDAGRNLSDPDRVTYAGIRHSPS